MGTDRPTANHQSTLFFKEHSINLRGILYFYLGRNYLTVREYIHLKQISINLKA